MSKPRPPVFERGVSAKFPGVARPYTHGHVGRHGLTYEHAADGGRWRSTRAGERTGIYDDHALSYTRYSYPADGDVVLHPDDATHAVYGGIDDELADARHTVAFPPDVGDLVQKLHATMKTALKFDRASPEAWAASATALAPPDVSLVRTCADASMHREIHFAEVLDDLAAFAANLPAAARHELHAGAAVLKRYNANHYNTFTMQCGTEGAFVALAVEVQHRFDHRAGEYEHSDELVRGGYMVLAAGAEFMLYRVATEPVTLRHDFDGGYTFVIRGVATQTRWFRADADGLETFNPRGASPVELTMTAFAGGRTAAQLVLHDE